MTKPELLSPAGNIEKLKTAFAYGADAVYMGLSKFSLRKNAENFTEEEVEEVKEIKRKYGKKIYATMNILFSEDDIEELDALKGELESWPFDAVICSDVGAASFFFDNYPHLPVHLSTQASCLNSSAVKMYKDMGFSRIILGREASLDDIKKIRDKCPDMEIEVFVHGAMCMAYSGRCLLSSFLTDRSANKGDCSHVCRWKFRLEEEKRKGEYFDIEEEGDYTTILSSKDLCMIDYVDDLVSAGVSSLKIEGRMKSVYYTALVTRAYRKALDKDSKASLYREDLFSVSHRPYTTAFYFKGEEKMQTIEGYERKYKFLGTVGKKDGGLYSLNVKNQILSSDDIEFVIPEEPYVKAPFTLYDDEGNIIKKTDHGKTAYLKTSLPLCEGSIIRKAES